MGTHSKDVVEAALDEIARLCGCDEWEYVGQVVRDVQALVKARDELRNELHRIDQEDRQPGGTEGCGDNSCIVERPRGMATNGGCCCARGTLRRALRRERERTAAAVKSEREACAKIAGDIAENNLTALNRLFDPSRATVLAVEARIEVAQTIARRIMERNDGTK